MKSGKLSGKLIFLPGVCWGALWIREFFSYPEMGFFACAAMLTGIGFLLMQKLPSRIKILLESVGTLLLVLPAGDFRTLLLPLIFGGTYAHTLQTALDNWRDSRKLCAGIILGAMASMLLPATLFPALLFFCTVFNNISGVWLKTAAALLAVLTGTICFNTPPQTANRISPGAILTALSWVKSDKTPQVSFVGSDRRTLKKSVYEIIPAAHVRFPETLSGGMKKSDLIIAVSLPDISDNGTRSLLNNLAPGGVVVVPVKYCGAMPEISWLTLPGSNNELAVGAKGRTLRFVPDEMDANLATFFRGKENVAPLRGALAGMLSEEKVSPPDELPYRSKRTLWLVVMLAAAATLGIYTFNQSKKTANPEFFRLMLNCGSYALMAALFLPAVPDIVRLPGISTLFIALGAAFCLRRPAPRRLLLAGSPGIISVVTMLFSLNGTLFWLLPALLYGGYAFEKLDGELRKNYPGEIEPVRFFAFACGIAAAWGITLLHLPWSAIIISVSAIRFYCWFRN